MSETARLNHQLATQLVGLLASGGVTDAVISPGSRSTPLVIALHEARADLRLHVVLDERSAAFFALGLARITGRPTLLLCTSGSAGGHWLPAVIEASRVGVPLVLLTADRPVELQGVGAPQTIDQRGLFSRHVRFEADLGAPAAGVSLRWLGPLVGRALDYATGPRPGPVHLNAPFRKPLWEPGPVASVPAPRPQAPRVLRGPPRLDEPALDALAARLSAAPRGVILAGPRERALGAEPDFPAAICALAERLGWPVLADPLSRVRFGPHDKSSVIAHGDALLRSRTFGAAHAPHLVLRFGQEPTSAAIASWAALHGRDRTLVVDPTGSWEDPSHVADAVIAASPAWLARELEARVPERTVAIAWLESWRSADRAAGMALAHHAADGLWEGAIHATIASALPEGSLLHLASSMPVRDADTWSPMHERAVEVVSSRGANGIDGTLAQALGAAVAWGGPATVVLGDQAFLHDIGSLQLARAHRGPFTAVVIDNGGGGIFGHLPIAAHPEAFEPYFLTPHQSDLGAIAAGFGVPVHRPRGVGELRGLLAQPADGFRLILLTVDRAEDRQRRALAHAAVLDAVERELPEITGDTSP